MKRYIYFDNAATTPMDRRVKEVMDPYMSEMYGNPSSMHSVGLKAHEAVDQARRRIAGLINTDPEEIFLPGVAQNLTSSY